MSAVQKVSPLAEHLLSNQIGWTKMCVNMLKCSEWTSPCEMNFLTQEHSTHVPVIDVAEWVASKPKPFGFSLSKHSHWYNIYHPWTYQVVGFPAQYKAELDWTTLNKSKQIRAHTQPQASLKNYIYPAKGYNGWKGAVGTLFHWHRQVIWRANSIPPFLIFKTQDYFIFHLIDIKWKPIFGSDMAPIEEEDMAQIHKNFH